MAEDGGGGRLGSGKVLSSRAREIPFAGGSSFVPTCDEEGPDKSHLTDSSLMGCSGFCWDDFAGSRPRRPTGEPVLRPAPCRAAIRSFMDLG